MSSLEALRTRHYAAKGIVVREGADTPSQIRMKYVGTVGVTSVTVTTGTSLITITNELVAGTSTPTTKTYLFATYITVGAVCDAINKDGLFEAYVVDALRSDSTTGGNYQINGAIAAGTDDNGVPCYDMLTDTSVSKAVTATLTPFKNFDAIKKGMGHVFHLQGINYFATLGGAGANLVRVYLRKGTVESQVFGAISASAADTAITFASGQGKITSMDGGEIIVRLQDGTSVSDTALYLQAVGIYE